MAIKRFTTKTPGVRYKLHATRKHGVGPDKYFSIRYRVDGKLKEESLGWASEGWSEKKAAAVLAELKANHTLANGPRTLEEKRDIESARREEAERQRLEEAARNITFAEVFERYLAHSRNNKRSPKSWQREESLFRLWIEPAIGNRPMREIRPLHLEKIKKGMTAAGRSPRSIQYCLAVIRQVFNYALNNDLVACKNPAGSTGGVKRPTLDNRRTRFLTREETTALLAELAGRSTDVHDMALFSLQTGARAGEVFSLTWGDIDLFQGTALLRDTKSNKNRPLFLTDEVKNMLARRRPADAKPTMLVFPDRNGNKVVQISDSFNRAIDKLGLNQDITDRRDKVTFHSLRHTYASQLVQAGVDIYHVKELLGHSTITLTERYSHLSDSALKQAALKIQNE
jgi:integrase